MLTRIAALLLATGLALGSSGVRAADWPARPITIVVPFDVGGSVDRLARGTIRMSGVFTPRRLEQLRFHCRW